jgi:hypothetical protein
MRDLTKFGFAVPNVPFNSLSLSGHIRPIRLVCYASSSTQTTITVANLNEPQVYYALNIMRLGI